MSAAERLIQEGREQGMQRGEKTKALAIAKNILLEGFDKMTTMKVTSLTQEELEKLV